MKCHTFKLFALGVLLGVLAPLASLSAPGSVRTLEGGRIRNGNAVLTLPTTTQTIQDIHTGATPTFAGINLPDDSIAQSKVIGLSTSLNAKQDTITSGSVGDIATWNGTAWVPGSPNVTSGGVITYFFDNAASDIGGYETLAKFPVGGAQVDEPVVVDADVNGGVTLIDSYGSSTTLGGTEIEGGVWTFDLYAAVNSGTGTTFLRASVYSRTAGGVETLLFSVDSPEINNTTAMPQLYEVQTVQPAFTLAAATDRLVVKMYGVTDASVAKTITFTYQGTSYYSHFHTPLIRRHNDLAGLQGGASGQYNHLTDAQVTALGDATKIKGVTVDDAAKADGKALVYKSGSGNLEYSTVSATGGGGPTNYVTNPSAATDATTGVTATNVTVARDTDAADAIAGVASYLLTSSTNLGSVCWATNALPADATGNGEWGAQYKGDGTKWELELRDGSDNVLAHLTVKSDTTYPLTNSPTYTPYSIGQSLTTHPLATGYKICAVHLGTGTDSLNVGNVTWRQAQGVGQYATARTVGTVKITGCNAAWNDGSTGAFADFSATGKTGCTYTPDINDSSFTVSAPDSAVPGFKISGPAGFYKMTASGTMARDSASASYGGFLGWWDGVTQPAQESYVYYNATQSSYTPTVVGTMKFTSGVSGKNIRIARKTENGAVGMIVAGTTANPLTITIEYSPLASQTAVTVDTSGGSWSGYHTPTCGWSVTGTSYGEGTDDATCDLTERKNTNFGAVTAYGAKKMGITWTPRAAGKTYNVCASLPVYSTTSGAYVFAKLYDGADVEMDSASFRQPSAQNSIAATLKLCGILSASSINPVTAKIKIASDGVGSNATSGSANSVVNSVEWTVVDISQSLPSPIFLNQLGTTAQNGRMVESAFITCAASSSFVDDGNWIQSVALNGTGDCTVTFKTSSTTRRCTPVIDSNAFNLSSESPSLWIYGKTATTLSVKASYRNASVNAWNPIFDLVCTEK